MESRLEGFGEGDPARNAPRCDRLRMHLGLDGDRTRAVEALCQNAKPGVRVTNPFTAAVEALRRLDVSGWPCSLPTGTN